MRIKINLNIFLFLVLFIITNQIEMYALIMIFALIHELAHLSIGLLLGFEAETFKIMPLGFSIEFKTKIDDYNKKIRKSNILSVKKIIVALSGPIINLIIATLGIFLHLDDNIIYANLLIFLFNLLPIYPLDGGRILKNILKIFYGKRKAIKYINIISNATLIILTMVASIAIIILENIAIFTIIICLWCLVLRENKRYKTYNKIYKMIDKI